MPEAVASNSIPVSEGQAKRKRAAPEGVPCLKAKAPFEGLASYIQRDFDAVEEMLRAHATMVAVMMESGDDFSAYSNGVHLIHQLIMLRLDEVADSARHEIEELHGGRFMRDRGDLEVMARFGRVIAAAYSEAGVEMDFDAQSDWTNDTWRTYTRALSKYREELEAKLEGDTHLLTVGSLLPWLEMKIWREIAGVDLSQKGALPGDASLRDRLIVEQARAGVSAADLSQAFGIKRGAVKRIIARLTGTEEELRDAV